MRATSRPAGSHGTPPGVLDSRDRTDSGWLCLRVRSAYLPAAVVEEEETGVDAVGACLVLDPLGVGSSVVLPHLVDEVAGGYGDLSGRVRSFD